MYYLQPLNTTYSYSICDNEDKERSRRFLPKAVFTAQRTEDDEFRRFWGLNCLILNFRTS